MYICLNFPPARVNVFICVLCKKMGGYVILDYVFNLIYNTCTSLHAYAADKFANGGRLSCLESAIAESGDQHLFRVKVWVVLDTTSVFDQTQM